MFKAIKAVFNRLLGRTSDTHPDSEDFDAYANADTIAVEQAKRTFPLQTLRGKGVPTNEKESAPWADPAAGYDSWVDVYEGPSGIGYVINYEIDKAGTKYIKRINYGPETYREQDWTAVPVPPKV